MCDIFEEVIIDDEIESIIFVGFEDTIDINVDNDRLFWANDILTHNSSVNEMEHDHSHISGGISKIQTADNVISILATPAMRDRGQYQFQFLKTRSSSGVGSKIIMGFESQTLRIYDLEDDGVQQQPVKTAADMLTDLKRKNSNAVAREPEPKQDTAPNLDKLKQLTSLIRR